TSLAVVWANAAWPRNAIANAMPMISRLMTSPFGNRCRQRPTIRMFPLPPAPHRLEKADPGGNRDVQALHIPAHRDAHEQVAALARQAAHALAFGAQHPGNRLRQVGLVERLLRTLVGAHDPDVPFLELG